MDVRRLVTALAAAFLLAAGTTYFFYAKVRGPREQVAMMRVIAATASLPAGAALTADNLSLVDWPAKLPLNGSFATAEDLVGRSLIYPVGVNQPILERDVAAAGSGIGLTVKIPEGMRATSVRSNEIVGVAGFLYPGSRVDVLVTYKPDNAQEAVTQTVLQNVEVLTAGQKIEPDPQGKAETVNVVTLLLTPGDSQKVVLASSQGTIQFVLRNGADQGSVPVSPVSLAQLSGVPKKDANPQPTGKHVAVKAPPAPTVYVVETIAGEKRTTEKF